MLLYLITKCNWARLPDGAMVRSTDPLTTSNTIRTAAGTDRSPSAPCDRGQTRERRTLPLLAVAPAGDERGDDDDQEDDQEREDELGHSGLRLRRAKILIQIMEFWSPGQRRELLTRCSSLSDDQSPLPLCEGSLAGDG